MKNIGDYIQKKGYEKRDKITNERQDILKKFVDRINAEREADGYRALPPAVFGVKLQLLSTKDLYIFYRECEESKNFSKYFWWKVKGGQAKE